jgi:hypothetical protein
MRKDESVMVAAAPHADDAGPVLHRWGFTVPATLPRVAEAIEESRALLDLEDDWDGEGTAGFAEETWQRAVDLLVRYATALWHDHGVAIDSVELLPASQGGLAIDWRTADGRELLITVPADSRKLAPFYGDEGAGGNQIKGSLDTAEVSRSLLAWLAG